MLARRFAVPCALAVICGLSQSSAAQVAVARSTAGVIEGVVTDTGLVVLSDVAVSMVGVSVLVTTGANGRFRIIVGRAGRYFLIARRLGFQPLSIEVQVPDGDTLRLALQLERVVTELQTVTVEAPARVSPRMAEFDARRKLGEGQFMTRPDIESRNSLLATELIRSFTSIKLVGAGGTLGSPGYYAVSIRGAATPLHQSLGTRAKGGAADGSCFLQVVIDGIPQDTPYNLDLLPPPRELAGIEVYSGPATIPIRFKGFDRSCGVILVWTRDGS